jgi:hypothetical protein
MPSCACHHSHGHSFLPLFMVCKLAGLCRVQLVRGWQGLSALTPMPHAYHVLLLLSTFVVR